MLPKLIALDIDGTLTNDEKKITADTLNTLLELQKKGVRIMPASARPIPGLYSVSDKLKLTEHHGILMAYNGGKVIDATDGTILSETHIDVEIALSILLFLKSLPVTVILDDGKRFYVEDSHGYKVEYECWNNQMECTEVDSLMNFLNFSPVKILLSVDPEQILNVQNAIRAQLSDKLSVVRTAPFYLEIIPASINKGKALLEVCNRLGINPADTAAFGDSENDIPMIQTAGCGIAMENAEDAVKASANKVTLSNNSDGIAYALREFF